MFIILLKYLRTDRLPDKQTKRPTDQGIKLIVAAQKQAEEEAYNSYAFLELKTNQPCNGTPSVKPEIG